MKQSVRIAAAVSIICALGVGLYMNFSKTSQNTLPVHTIMVCVYK